MLNSEPLIICLSNCQAYEVSKFTHFKSGVFIRLALTPPGETALRQIEGAEVYDKIVLGSPRAAFNL